MSPTTFMPPAAVNTSAGTAESLWHRIVATSDSLAPTLARLGLGGVMFVHGAQKALGWFGGPGLSGTLGFFHGKLGIPAPLAALAVAAEFLGSLACLCGFLTRIAAAGIATIMLVAIATVHAPHGFFMNWTGTQKGEGFEYHILAIALAAALMVAGGGRASIDGWLTHRRPR